LGISRDFRQEYVIGSTVWRFYQRNCCRLEGLTGTSSKSGSAGDVRRFGDFD